MPRHDDLLGAIVAHEIGHLLGVRHASSGLMHARLDANDIIAFRRGRLRFSPAEAHRMRITALGWSGAATPVRGAAASRSSESFRTAVTTELLSAR